MQANSRNRSALLGGARAPVVGAAGPSGSIYDDETAKAIESHSNKLQEELHSKVLALKSIAQGFHTEVLDQNRSLDGMQDDMSRTNNSLSDSLNKLGQLVSNGGSMHVCHLVAFAVFIFVLLYFAITRW